MEDDLCDKKKLYKPKKFIYIMTSDNYKKKNMYNVGTTNNIDSVLNRYNKHIARGSEDEKYFMFVEKTKTAPLVERFIEEMLGNFKVTDKENSEMYHIGYDILHSSIINVINSFTQFHKDVQTLIKNNKDRLYEVTYAPPIVMRYDGD